MSEENKALIRRFAEEMNKGNLKVYDDLFGHDYVVHPPKSMNLPNPANLAIRVQIAKTFLSAFPDLRHSVDDLIAEGDKVVARLTVSGTHKGDFRGIPPTGKRVTTQGIVVFRISNGKIVEEWALLDSMGLMQQLGDISPPGQAKPNPSAGE